jgi:protein-S-isoprenylcysteine O-methyltransferase Ste14
MLRLWTVVAEFIADLVKKKRYQRPTSNPWMRKLPSIFGSLMITTSAFPLFLLACFPETFEGLLKFVISGTVSWHIAVVVIIVCLVYFSGIAVIIGCIASDSIGDDATKHDLMMRGIHATFIVFIAIGGAVLIGIWLYYQIVRIREARLLKS